MKLTAMILAVAAIAGAHMRTQPAGQTLTVYINDARNDRRVSLGGAEEIASHMFAKIGLRLQWRAGLPAVDPTPADMTVVINVVDNTPLDRKPGALAFAQAFEGVHLTVFFDRIAGMDRAWPCTILSHVLVHEITHLLEQVARHSETGVMKPSFTRKDVMQMRREPLPFADDDVTLVNAGIASRLGFVLAPAVVPTETSEMAR